MAMSDTITQIRTEKGLTQEQMARDLFVTPDRRSLVGRLARLHRASTW